MSAPATLALSFPAPVAAVNQKTPPWVGQPDPPTAAASTSASASQRSGGAGSTGSHGFPIWVAVVILLFVVAAAVLVECRRRGAKLAMASTAPSRAPDVVDPMPPPPPAGAAALETRDTVVSEPEDRRAVHVTRSSRH